MKKKLINILTGDEYKKKLDKDSMNLFKFSKMEILILRGHILIEHDMDEAIMRTVYYDEHYEPDKFTFSQKLTIACMIGVANKFKYEIKSINKLRNQIAHTLDYEEKIVDAIISNFKKYDPIALKDRNDRLQALSYILGAINGQLNTSPVLVKLTQAFDVLDELKKLNKSKEV